MMKAAEMIRAGASGECHEGGGRDQGKLIHL